METLRSIFGVRVGRLSTTLRLVAGVLVLGSGAAWAQVKVYDDGASSNGGGDNIFTAVTADSFTLGAAEDVTDVRFWEAQTETLMSTNVQWWIYQGNSGSPAATALATGTAAFTQLDTTKKNPTNAGGGEIYQDDFSIGSLMLSGGTTYWLALKIDPTPNQVIWEASSGGTSLSEINTGTGWTSTGDRNAFQLFAPPASTPEPLTIGLSLAGIGLAVRRRMKAKRSQ
jgi:hypothetical protein